MLQMTKATFDHLVELVRDSMGVDETSPHAYRAVPVRKRVAVGLYTLASTAEMRVIGAVFGLGTSTVHKCFRLFLEWVPNAVHEIPHNM